MTSYFGIKLPTFNFTFTMPAPPYKTLVPLSTSIAGLLTPAYTVDLLANPGESLINVVTYRPAGSVQLKTEAVYLDSSMPHAVAFAVDLAKAELHIAAYHPAGASDAAQPSLKVLDFAVPLPAPGSERRTANGGELVLENYWSAGADTYAMRQLWGSVAHAAAEWRIIGDDTATVYRMDRVVSVIEGNYARSIHLTPVRLDNLSETSLAAVMTSHPGTTNLSSGIVVGENVALPAAVLADTPIGFERVGHHIVAGAGDDMLFAGASTLSFIGGGGLDGASYRTLSAQSSIFLVAAGDGYSVTKTLRDTTAYEETIHYANAGEQRMIVQNDHYSGVVNDYLEAEKIEGSPGNDILQGGAHRDVFSGGAGNDLLLGASGDDQLDGSQGNDTLNGGSGDDSVMGSDGNDSLIGGDGRDSLWGGAGSDRLFGNNGNDELTGNEGNDYLSGGDGDDRLFGSDGDDTLTGDQGNDYLQGAAGNDMLIGGSGQDSLAAGAGNDTLNGGAGNDTYFFFERSGDYRVIEDHTAGELSTLMFPLAKSLVSARVGQDLLLSGVDGIQVTIVGYFDGNINISIQQRAG